jgi:proteic killer suppression protein
MIKSFADSMTEALFEQGRHRRFPNDVAQRTFIKLRRLHAADSLNALRIPPSNNLEKLSGDRKDYWSIRINKQWRICFMWQDGQAIDVSVVDYH